MASQDSPRPLQTPHPRLIVLLVSVALMAAYFNWYGETSYGASPVLDGRENIDLAQRFAANDLPHEPFYRAPLYPILLGCFLKLGLTSNLLPWLARIVNGFALLLSGWYAGKLAETLWASRLAGALAMALVCLNPVVLFFAADPYDILVATACLAAATFYGCEWLRTGAKNWRTALLCSAALAAGSLARSHLLIVGASWLMLVLCGARSKKIACAFSALTATALPFLLLGAANWSVSREFRITPWQGPYNFWSANGPDANGRHYSQSVNVSFAQGYDNPAKLESIQLFETANGRRGSVTEMNRFWNERARSQIINHPLIWMALMARKFLSVVHNYEQYDNKTYSFERERTPFLRWNPLNWGILICGAAAGVISLQYRANQGPRILFLFFAAYFVGVLLFHPNNRFRVPLVPLLATAAGGVVMWSGESTTGRRKKVVIASLMAIFVFPNWLNVAGADTTGRDYALHASAALGAGRDDEALFWAESGLRRSPQKTDLYEIKILARFNLLIARPAFSSRKEIQVQLDECRTLQTGSEKINFVHGVYAWKLGLSEEARNLWIEAANQKFSGFQSSLSALVFCRLARGEERAVVNAIPPEKRDLLLTVALAQSGDSGAATWLSRNTSQQDVVQARQILEAEFSIAR